MSHIIEVASPLILQLASSLRTDWSSWTSSTYLDSITASATQEHLLLSKNQRLKWTSARVFRQYPKNLIFLIFCGFLLNSGPPAQNTNNFIRYCFHRWTNYSCLSSLKNAKRIHFCEGKDFEVLKKSRKKAINFLTFWDRRQITSVLQNYFFGHDAYFNLINQL